MRSSWRTELPQIAIIAALFAWSLLLWPSAAESLPVHFDVNGNVDRMGGKLEGLFAVPALALGLYGLLRFLPLLDPARANYSSFAPAYATIRLAVLVMLAMIDLAILLPVVGIAVDEAVVMRLIFGGLFAVLGAVMGKIRPNWFVGIRTPWTLSSKESWVKTHRVGGWVFILIGLVFVASSTLPPTPGLVISFGTLIIGVAWTVVYSYLVWQRDPVRYPATSARPASE